MKNTKRGKSAENLLAKPPRALEVPRLNGLMTIHISRGVRPKGQVRTVFTLPVIGITSKSARSSARPPAPNCVFANPLPLYENHNTLSIPELLLSSSIVLRLQHMRWNRMMEGVLTDRWLVGFVTHPGHVPA